MVNMERNNQIQKNNQKNKFLQGAFSLTLSVIIVKVIGFVYKLPLSYILSDEGMGYFNSAYTIFSFFYLLCTGGVPRAVSILVTEAKVKGKSGEIKKILRSALIFFVSLGTIFAALIIIFAQPLSNLIGNISSMFSLISIAPSLMFISAAGVLRGYLNGEEKFTPIAISGIFEGIVKFVFGLLFAIIAVKLNYGAPIISAFTIFGVTLGSFIGALVLYFPSAKLIFAADAHESDISSSAEIMKKIIKISTPLTISSGIMGISAIIDLGLIMHRLNNIGYTEIEATALYGNYTTLVVPMLNLVSALIAPISAAALPVITALYVRRDYDALREKSYGFLKMISFFLIPVSIGFMLFSEEILIFLFEDASAAVAAPSLVLLSPAIAFMGILTLTNTFLEATADTKSTLIAMLIGTVTKIIVSYLLLGNPEIGIKGAPIGTTISYAVSVLVSALFLMKKKMFGFNMFLPFFKPILFSFAAVLFSKIMYKKLSNNEFSLGCFLFFVTMSILMYFLFYMCDWFISRKKGQKESISPKIFKKN